MSRYLIISADCHAGLPTREYRSYLESKYHQRFDESVREIEATREAEMAKRGMSNPEFAKKWYEENEEGLRGGWDAARRDKELDGDGVAGEVLFSDADAVTGINSAPFGAGLGRCSRAARPQPVHLEAVLSWHRLRVGRPCRPE